MHIVLLAPLGAIVRQCVTLLHLDCLSVNELGVEVCLIDARIDSVGVFGGLLLGFGDCGAKGVILVLW